MHQFLEKIELGIKHLAFAIQIGLNLPVSVAKRYNGSHIGSNTIFYVRTSEETPSVVFLVCSKYRLRKCPYVCRFFQK